MHRQRPANHACAHETTNAQRPAAQPLLHYIRLQLHIARILEAHRKPPALTIRLASHAQRMHVAEHAAVQQEARQLHIPTRRRFLRQARSVLLQRTLVHSVCQPHQPPPQRVARVLQALHRTAPQQWPHAHHQVGLQHCSLTFLFNIAVAVAVAKAQRHAGQELGHRIGRIRSLYTNTCSYTFSLNASSTFSLQHAPLQPSHLVADALQNGQ
mmetsp:Transcript_37124/g.69073  ORF Transcript_37124/g.69073 Transcript_37124/m.69073 type:complete len:212 (-) Transcript_37124:171-806(-)